MRLIKIGVANVNTTVGAFVSNTDKAVAYARELAEAGCTIGCFQEQVIGGYPGEDLVQWRRFVAEQRRQLQRFADATRDFPYPTVFTVGLTVEHGGHLYNVAAVVNRGRVLGFVPKEKLPTYGVFYENRTYSPGYPGMSVEADGVTLGDLIFRFPFGTMAVETCEDVWSPDGPMRRRTFSGAEIVINGSASPNRSGVLYTRRELLATRSSDNQTALVYVNQYGGNDSLVFDGGHFIYQNGRLVQEGVRWQEGWTTQVIDLDRTSRLRRENTTWRTDATEFLKHGTPVRVIDVADGPTADNALAYPAPANRSFFIPADERPENPQREYFRDLIESMICGLDYYEKTFRRGPIGIALSGGKDSVLTLVIAWLYMTRRAGRLPAAERAKFVRDSISCFSMPTRFNSATTRGISSLACEELGVSFNEQPIEEAFARECAAAKAMFEPGQDLPAITLQNIQARIRAQRMWNWANAAHGFWLQTGNMSEKAVGYTTVGGDLMGAYSLIGNLPKTVIIALLRFIAAEYGWQFVKDVLATEASAELADNQADEKDLMPFPVLDACMALYAGEKLDEQEMVAALRSCFPEHDGEQLAKWVTKFVSLFHRSIFKWVQCPESVHLGSLELDRERALQFPVVQSDEWLRGQGTKAV